MKRMMSLDQMNSFDKISEEYREKSLVQQKAAVKLFDLLKI